MNLTGLFRSAVLATATSTSLNTRSWQEGVSASPVEGIAAAVGPVGLLVLGPLAVGTAACWTNPDAYEELQKAKGSQGIEKDHVISVARLGLANQCFYGAMGAGQTAVGVVGMLASETVASTMKYTPVLTGAAGATATLVASLALGGIYAARGVVMTVRSL